MCSEIKIQTKRCHSTGKCLIFTEHQKCFQLQSTKIKRTKTCLKKSSQFVEKNVWVTRRKEFRQSCHLLELVCFQVGMRRRERWRKKRKGVEGWFRGGGGEKATLTSLSSLELILCLAWVLCRAGCGTESGFMLACLLRCSSDKSRFQSFGGWTEWLIFTDAVRLRVIETLSMCNIEISSHVHQRNRMCC